MTQKPPRAERSAGTLRRRVQAYLQAHGRERPTAPGLAERLSAPLSETAAALAELVAAGAVDRVGRGPEPAYAPSARQRRLGAMLVESELITLSQLEEALAEQAKTGERLGQILVNRGFLTKQALGETLEAQKGLPYVNLAAHPIDEALLRSVPTSLITEHKAAPFARVGREVHVALLDPTDVVAIDQISALVHARVRPFLTTERDLEWLISTYFGITTTVSESLEAVGAGAEAEPDFATVSASTSPHDPPVVRLVDSLIQAAVRDVATDIHIEPEADGTAVRYRLDGLLYDKARLPRGVAAAVTSRIKALAGLDVAERVRPQDGRLLYTLNGREHDLRLATVGASFGERITIRILDKSRVLVGLERLGLLPDQQAVLERLLGKPYGLILVTGPTGCGKTTTLYSCISRINERSRNIMTVEDPVEYHLPGVTQIAVRTKMAVSFATGLRALIRQDPDVIMVGEVRDPETAQIAVQASLTGHLVLSTLHTNDAPGAVVRLIDMGIEPYLITSTLLAAVGQRLVRILCPLCKEASPATPEQLQELGLPADARVVLSAPAGCAECGHLGYRGRTGVFEIMQITDEIRELILQRRSATAIREAAQRAGMQTVREAGVAKALDGVTSLEELRRVVFAEIG
ncbi:MAG: Flp pilus assembly complex ATPase component TadA [Armatimonadetes bacterium]|nr:Flp pilus assembly complex ATPase component TadA [Armatimonadota bacterium]